MLKKLLPELIFVLATLQHGFIPGRCCAIQSLSVLHDSGSSVYIGDEIRAVYLDLGKAFGSVPFSLLGTQGSLHAWFMDHLSSRSQRVVVDGVLSPWVYQCEIWYSSREHTGTPSFSFIHQ